MSVQVSFSSRGLEIVGLFLWRVGKRSQDLLSIDAYSKANKANFLSRPEEFLIKASEHSDTTRLEHHMPNVDSCATHNYDTAIMESCLDSTIYEKIPEIEGIDQKSGKNMRCCW